MIACGWLGFGVSGERVGLASAVAGRVPVTVEFEVDKSRDLDTIFDKQLSLSCLEKAPIARGLLRFWRQAGLAAAQSK